MNKSSTEQITLPSDWSVVSLDQIAHIEMGQSPDSTSYNEGGVGIYLIQGNADIKNRKTIPRVWTSEPTKTCKVGDILMTVRAPVGAIAKSLHHACIGRGVCAIRPTKAVTGFLYQYLINCEPSWKALEQGSTFTAVNSKDVKGLKINLPPWPVQQKIAEILSTVDEKIEVIEEQIAQTTELKKGLMQRLLTKGIGHTQFKDSPLGEIPETWECLPLSSVCPKGYEITYGVLKPEAYCEGGIPMLQIKDVKTNKVNCENLHLISTSLHLKYRRTILSKNDLVFSLVGTVGKVAIIPEKLKGANIHRNLGLIKVSEDFSHKYLYQILLSEFVQTSIKNQTKGSTQSLYNLSDLRELLLPFPLLDEQRKIADILQTVDRKTEVLSLKREFYHELKKGLMQQLLTGKLRVNHLIESEALA